MTWRRYILLCALALVIGAACGALLPADHPHPCTPVRGTSWALVCQ